MTVGHSGSIGVRRLDENEWRELRELRLRALAESPDAFGSTLESEKAEPDERWQRWAAEGAQGEDQITFVVLAGQRWVGMAIGVIDEDDASLALLFAMWVDPAVRRRGAGARLVRAVEDWARSRGATRVLLSVTESNGAARKLYERTGFAYTGDPEPLREGSSVLKLWMEKPVGASR